MTKEIKLTRGQIALVDDEDYGWLSKWKWYAHQDVDGRYYAARTMWTGNRKKSPHPRMHREIMNAPKGMDVDHINHNGLDNRKCNLRLATRRQNSQNSKRHSNATYFYKGLTLHRPTNTYQVRIRVNGKMTSLGYFHNIIDAALAYDKAAKKYFGEFAYLNFPD